MADEAPKGAQNSQEEKERARQTAVAPLNTIGLEDIGAGKAKIDAWLRWLTKDYVSLDTLLNVAGSIPVIGNIMALIDAVWDVIDMITKKLYTDVLQWVSLALNLLGVIPLPPGTNAARMSLRPMLHLLRQELAKTAENVISAVFIDVITRHLNDTIAGSLDKFVEEAEGYLDDFLQKCASKAEEIADGVIGALQIALGDKQLFAIDPGSDKNIYDPNNSTYFGRLMGRLERGSKKAANALASNASQLVVSAPVRAMVNEVIGSLRNLKGYAKDKILQLGKEAVTFGIKWMIVELRKALLKRKGSLRANVSGNKGAEANKPVPGGEKGAIGNQSLDTTDPGCKNGPACAGTPNSISFSMGCETFTHVDFVLTAQLPITWARTYRSNLGAFDQGSLGARWLVPYSTRVDIATPTKGKRRGKKSLIYHGSDGRSHAYPLLALGQSHRDTIEEVTLTRLSDSLLTLDFGKPMPAGTPSEWRETYELVKTVPAKAKTQGKQHFRLVAQHASHGGAIGLRYDHVIAATGEQVLSDIVSKHGEATLAHVGTRPNAQSGLIESLWEIKDGQVVRQLAAYAHDVEGDLVSAQDEDGASWNYSYNHHLVTRYTDRTSRGMNLEYNGTGADAKAVREWSDDGSFALKLEWDKNIRLTYVTDALGQETWYYYDILGYTYRVIHPNKLEEWFYRDNDKNVTCHVHTDASADSYAYDLHGNIRTHTRADGSRIHFEYNARHRVTRILDAEGGIWKRDYDDQDHLIEEIDPLGHRIEYGYDKSGRPVRVTDAKGGIKELTYTSAGQLASHTDCSGKTTQWVYDSRGRLIRVTNALGQTTRYRYTDPAESTQIAPTAEVVVANHPGQLEEIVHPDSTSEHFVHDAEGRLHAHTDPLGRCTTYGYTRAGLVAERTDATGQTLKYAWDLLGRLSELRNENGSRYSFKYDPVGKLLEETGFDRKTTEYRYERTTGVLAEVVEADHLMALQFDPLGRLSERKVADQAEHFVYDGNGRLIEATNDGAKLQWFYDGAGNLVREHQHYLDDGHTAVWQHGYNELNQRIATIRPDGHVVQWLTYGSGHVHGLLIDGQDILGFERDDLHREIGRDQGNGLHQGSKYNAVGRLLEQQISYTKSGTTASVPGADGAMSTLNIRRSYQYDKAGQLIAIGDSRRGSLSYRYDPVGRLLEANSRLGRETFAFDPAGNIGNPADAKPDVQAAGRITTRVAVRLDPEGRSIAGRLMDNLLKDYAGTHYKWDARGNLIERSRNGEKTIFTWDGYNRMRSAETFGETTSFRYDALGRRITKSTSHTTTLFCWDGDALAFESTQSTEGQQELAWRGDSIHYIHEPGSFVPLVQIRQAKAVSLSETTDVKALIAANGGSYDIEQDPLWNGALQPTPEPFAKEETAFYHCDHLGTPQELTDHVGHIAWSAQYKAWGEAKQAISEAGRKAGFRNPIRLQGQYFDEETGLHYNRHRYYDPHSGRFVSKDPIGLLGGLNSYEFGPNTVQYLDPRGLTAKKLGAALGNAGRPVQPGQTPHHIVQENCGKNQHVKNSREILKENDIGIDSPSNGARLWGTQDSQVAVPGHPGRAAAAATGTYHAGPHIHSDANDKLIYQVLKGVNKRGGNVENALQDIGRRMESGSWKTTFGNCN